MKLENKEKLVECINRVITSENEERTNELISLRNQVQLQQTKIRDIEKEKRTIEKQLSIYKELLIFANYKVCDACWWEKWFTRDDWHWWGGGEECGKCLGKWFLSSIE